MNGLSARIMGKKQDADDDYKSEVSSVFGDSKEQAIAYEDLMGLEDMKNKGEPVKGRKYFVFTLIMMLLLVVLVELNVTSESLTKAAMLRVANEKYL